MSKMGQYTGMSKMAKKLQKRDMMVALVAEYLLPYIVNYVSTQHTLYFLPKFKFRQSSNEGLEFLIAAGGQSGPFFVFFFFFNRWIEFGC